MKDCLHDFKRNAVLEDTKIEKNGISIEELPFMGKN